MTKADDRTDVVRDNLAVQIGINLAIKFSKLDSTYLHPCVNFLISLQDISRVSWSVRISQ